MAVVSMKYLSSSTAPTAPRIFRITAVTTTSLSFSWQQPTNPNGEITGYQLSCQPLLLGIPSPEPLSPGPTARMAVLADLHPGVRYDCGIGASNSAGLSNLVYADGTTMESGRSIALFPPPFVIITTLKNFQNVMRCRDSRSVKSREKR